MQSYHLRCLKRPCSSLSTFSPHCLQINKAKVRYKKAQEQCLKRISILIIRTKEHSTYVLAGKWRERNLELTLNQWHIHATQECGQCILILDHCTLYHSKFTFPPKTPKTPEASSYMLLRKLLEFEHNDGLQK